MAEHDFIVVLRIHMEDDSQTVPVKKVTKALEAFLSKATVYNDHAHLDWFLGPAGYGARNYPEVLTILHEIT